jgi:hypothetical protein
MVGDGSQNPKCGGRVHNSHIRFWCGEEIMYLKTNEFFF